MLNALAVLVDNTKLSLVPGERLELSRLLGGGF